MTHHQIPNEICIWKSQMIEFLDGRRKEVVIGVNQDNYDGALYYIRKDAFIKKACKWLKEVFEEYENITDYNPMEDFRKAMEE